MTDIKAHPREWVTIAIGAAMILGFFLLVRELLLPTLGTGLVLAGLFGDQLRSLTIGEKGIELETWKRVVAERVLQKVTGQGAMTVPGPTLNGGGTVTTRRADSALHKQRPTVDEISDAKTPNEFADRLVQVIDLVGMPSQEEGGTPTVRVDEPRAADSAPDQTGKS